MALPIHIVETLVLTPVAIKIIAVAVAIHVGVMVRLVQVDSALI
jgi:hypothetical protein